MKIKHYSVFRVHSNKIINWNDLRDEELELPYWMPASKDKYLTKVNAEKVSESVLAMIEQIQKIGYTKILSLGSGIAQTEYHIKQNSNLEVVVSDNTDSIKRLKEYNIFSDALLIDIVRDDFPANEKTLILLHRIDTEFDNEDFKLIFDKCKKLNVKHICVVPTNPLAYSIVLNELKTVILSIMKFKKRTFCGYARSKSSLIKLWAKYYKIVFEHNKEKPFYIIEAQE